MKNVNVMNEIEVLNAALAVGWVRFSYYKADGSLRVAIGTRNRAIIETMLGRTLHGENHGYYEKYNGYFDLGKMGWRQFNTERFNKIEYSNITNEQAVAYVMVESYLFEDEDTYDLFIEGSKRMIGLELVETIYRTEICSLPTFFDDKDSVNMIMAKKRACEKGLEVLVRRGISQKKEKSRSELIAELKELQKRENEILALLS